MYEYRLRATWRKVILLLIACTLLLISSAQQYVVARSLAIFDPSHANMQAEDMIGLYDHHGGSQLGDVGAENEARDSQNGLCNALSCVAFAAIVATVTEIASADGQRYLAVGLDDINGHDVFDLMRPPRI